MLVDWAFEYLVIEHGESCANEIMDDIDQLHLLLHSLDCDAFPHRRRFKQWTGDDSKALMKVFLPAVAEYLPEEMMKCLSSFLEFCYLDCPQNLPPLPQYFQTSGVHEHFSLPRMHAMIHYPALIIDFGAPNGLCSSITESRHISAVTKPWWRSNCYNALTGLQATPPTLTHPSRSFDVEKDDIGPVDSNLATSKVELAKRRDPSYPRNILIPWHSYFPTATRGLDTPISWPNSSSLMAMTRAICLHVTGHINCVSFRHCHVLCAK
ncbi:hypothetical protein BT96DRAFT_1009473 [Gymnopus androsaceus JB14]|uniref:Uncharacterized protein n=1 Tax=Gymnopus androsaceus JB14 TaxID=1447944 RepID=A0A6A4GCL7_9AGAR|nr:hypothetical protein BT96DRAFT_1009473 [Gymnopus androsaceus JB14]